MILGVGTDLVEVEAFRAQLADVASIFTAHTFTARELDASSSRASRDPARHLAARYAAKEAFIKAWAASRFDQPPALSQLDMREIEVTQDPYGRPHLLLHGEVARAFARTTPGSLHLSLTHDGHYAMAFVVISQAQAGVPQA